MKKNKSVPNLRTSKQNKPSTSNDPTIIETLFQSLFGVKNKDTVNFSNSPAGQTRNESLVHCESDSRSYRNFMSEPVGTVFEEDSKRFSVFKKFSIRLGSSKKDKIILKCNENTAVVKDMKVLRENVENRFNHEGQTDTEMSLNSPGFVRQRKSQMSMRKAFGIFEDDVSNVDAANNNFETKDETCNNEYLHQLHKLIMSHDSDSSENNPKPNSNASDQVPQDVRLSSDFPANHVSYKESIKESNKFFQDPCNELMEGNENRDANGDSTLKPGHYADQLREQARRLSLSKHSEVIFNSKRNKSGRTNRRESCDPDHCDQRKELKQNSSFPGRFENEMKVEIQNEANDSVSNYFKSKHENDYCPIQNTQPLNKSSKIKVKEKEKAGLRCKHSYDDDNQTLSMVGSKMSPCQTGNETGIGTSYIDDTHDYRELYRDHCANNEWIEDSNNCESPETAETSRDQVFRSPITDPIPAVRKSLFSDQRFAPVKFDPNSSITQNRNKIKSSSSNRHEPTAKPSKTRRKRNSASSKQSLKVCPEIAPSTCRLEFNQATSGDSDVFDCPPFHEHDKEIKLRKVLSCDNIRNKKLEGCELKRLLIRKMSVEKRGKLSEERDCEEFASSLAEKIKLIDPQLSTILLVKYKSIQDRLPTLSNIYYCPDSNNDSTWMMGGRSKRSVEPSKHEVKYFPTSIEQEKNEMENMLVKKIDALCQEKNSLERDIVNNNEFGVEACKTLSDYLDSKQVEKFLALVQEMEKVVKLILKLGNMLTRTEESHLNMPHNSTDKEKAVLHNKMESLKSRLNEAKLIKESVDSKYEQILYVSHDQLPSSVTKNFDIFLTNKSFLMIELEELGSEICLAQTQLHSLRTTMIKNSVGTNC